MQKLTEQIAVEQNNARNKDSELLLSAAQNFYQAMSTLYRYYVDLILSKEEYHDCVSYILHPNLISNFDSSRYLFVPINLKSARESTLVMKKTKPWDQILIFLKTPLFCFLSDI